MRKLLLEHEGYRVLTAAGEGVAAGLLQREAVDLVLLDYSVADAGRVAGSIRQIRSALPIVLISFSASFPTALNNLIDGWVSKTRNPDVLLRRIEQLLGKKQGRDI